MINKLMIVMLMLVSTNLYAKELSVLDKITKVCQYKYINTPRLISYCVTQQKRAHDTLDDYLIRKYSGIKPKDPVFRILASAMKKYSIVLGKDGIGHNWIMIKFKFKRDMQLWLSAKGIRDQELDYGL